MSEPYGGNWRQYSIWPRLTNQSGAAVSKIKLNIGTTAGSQGPQGPTGIGSQGPQGPQGPAGNPSMQLTSPNLAVYEIVVDDLGVLSTIQITPPPNPPSGPTGPQEDLG